MSVKYDWLKRWGIPLPIMYIFRITDVGFMAPFTHSRDRFIKLVFYHDFTSASENMHQHNGHRYKSESTSCCSKAVFLIWIKLNSCQPSSNHDDFKEKWQESRASSLEWFIVQVFLPLLLSEKQSSFFNWPFPASNPLLIPQSSPLTAHQHTERWILLTQIYLKRFSSERRDCWSHHDTSMIWGI